MVFPSHFSRNTNTTTLETLVGAIKSAEFYLGEGGGISVFDDKNHHHITRFVTSKVFFSLNKDYSRHSFCLKANSSYADKTIKNNFTI